MKPREVGELVIKWRNRLALGVWWIRFHCVKGPRLPKCHLTADVQPCRRSMWARLRIAVKRPAADIERSVCHELCHLTLNDLAALFDCAIDRVPKGERRLLLRQWRDAEERTVLRLERAFLESE